MNSNKTRIQSITIIGLFTSIICILGPMSIVIPVSPVPISFTNLAIYFTAIILGSKKGTVSYLIYLAIGFIGLPVFSGFTGGPGKLFGPTGGYLIGFILMAAITGYFADKYPNKRIMSIIGMVIGTIITYGIGTAWLGYIAHMSFEAALFAGVLPYIPGDAIKILIAIMVAPIIKERVIKAGSLK